MPLESTLRVRVVVPQPFRVAAIEKEFGLSASEAEGVKARRASAFPGV
jgi:hypothetical protein